MGDSYHDGIITPFDGICLRMSIAVRKIILGIGESDTESKQEKI